MIKTQPSDLALVETGFLKTFGLRNSSQNLINYQLGFSNAIYQGSRHPFRYVRIDNLS